MSNRSNLPSLDELSFHIARHLKLNIGIIASSPSKYENPMTLTIEELNNLISDAICEISTQEK
jgi:hypothetical protein